MNLSFCNTGFGDIEALVQIRIDAMRESLERIGRFDPQRARERFVSSFDPALCRFIVIDALIAGFVQTRLASDRLKLEHFYVAPAYQGQGVGSAALNMILADADAGSLTVKLGALRGSDSNRFYQRHGFVKQGEDEWDIYYSREPR